MSTTHSLLTPEQEILLLRFWAISMEIAQRFPPRMHDEIAGLQAALTAAAKLPAAIGWNGEAVAGTYVTPGSLPRVAPAKAHS